jgi:hypothetical protein
MKWTPFQHRLLHVIAILAVVVTVFTIGRMLGILFDQ